MKVAALFVSLLIAAPAGASSWPMAGGNGSRSGHQGVSAGEAPVELAWSRADADIRTPMVITTGGGPGSQRVAYGTADGSVHLASLETGAPVGRPEGTRVVSATVDSTPADTFGTGVASIAFADTSSDTRPGILYVVHNDGQGVEIARIDVATGERLDNVDATVSSSFGCTANGSPVLTPPAAGGSRILFLTLRGSCPADQSLVRVPIDGDASSAGATFGTQTFARLDGLAQGVGPSLVVLRDPKGTPRYYVAIGRTSGVDFYDAGRGLDASPSPALTTPADFTAALGDGEVAMTLSAPATEDGAVAGGEGSGAPQAPEMFVAASVGGQTKVYRLAQNGSAVAVAGASDVIPDSGVPAPALAAAETAGASGLSADGRIVVTSASRLTLLRTSDLRVITAMAAGGTGRGFARTAAATSGNLAFVSTDGAGDVHVAPRQMAMRLDTGALLGERDFAPAAGAEGVAWGQPAIARRTIVFGTPSGAFAYRTSDPEAPDEKPQPVPDCTITLRGSTKADHLVGGEPGERLLGGRGRDRLEGRGGKDCISGGADGDRLSGGDGDDTLKGGSGRNRVSGGDGDDRVEAVNHKRDVVRCGHGRDHVRADRVDKVAKDCERVRRVRR